MEMKNSYGGARQGSGRKKLDNVLFQKRVPKEVKRWLEIEANKYCPDYPKNTVLYFLWQKKSGRNRLNFITSARIIDRTSDYYLLDYDKEDSEKLKVYRLYYKYKLPSWSHGMLTLDDISDDYKTILEKHVKQEKSHIVKALIESKDQDLKDNFLDLLMRTSYETALYQIACKLKMKYIYSCEYCDARYNKNALEPFKLSKAL